MNTDDREFILSVLEDYAEMIVGLDLDDRLPGVNRAIRLLQHNYYQADDRADNFRQKELDFSDYKDWHHDPELLDESEDD